MMDFWIEHPTAPVGATPCGCPFCLWLHALFVVLRNQGRHCPYGPPRRWGNPLWLPVLFVVARFVVPNQGRHGGLPLRFTPPLGQPPVVTRLFAVARFMVPNQGRHGGLPLRSTPRRGNPLWLPVLFVVARIIRRSTESGQAQGPAPTVHPAVGATPCGCPFVRRCPYYLSFYGIRAGTGACPYGPTRVGATPCGCCRFYLSLPVCSWLHVLFVVLRNQGRHGGLPLRSTPRWGNPLWLPVCSWLPGASVSLVDPARRKELAM